jgi:para-nitrobenzyl esterase
LGGPDNPLIPGTECLNLNVWTPDPLGAGLPVLVWIHGGGFVSGSNAIPYCDGSNFAADGVVTVAVNYRLGEQGFGTQRNLGVQDWLAALGWVRANIATFGGDPHRVTVMGYEAGGGAVALMLGMPAAEGLFQQAIVMSGTLTASGTGPVVDGELIPADPVAAARTGAGRGIPVLLGIPSAYLISPEMEIDQDALRELFHDLGLPDGAGERYQTSFLGASRREIAAHVRGDRALRVPLLELAEARAATGATTHVYLFAGRFGSEVPYAFDTLDLAHQPHPSLPLAETMHAAWVDFAAKGDPGWPGYEESARTALVFDEPACRLALDPLRFERELWT